MRPSSRVWVLALILLVFGASLSLAIAADKQSPKGISQWSNAAKKPGDFSRERDLVRIDQKIKSGERLSDYEKTLWADAVSHGSPNRPNSLDNQGGPDAFGYAFVDNQGGDTATYAWIELRDDEQATWLAAADFASTDDGMTNNAIDIGFDFPFYGASYNSCHLGSNGDIQFNTSYAFEYTTCLPRANSGAMVTALATDLHLMRGGIADGNAVVGYRNFGTYWVVEYDSVGFYNTGTCPNGSLKFEMILFNSGAIKFQYNNLVIPEGCFGTYAPNIGIQGSGTGPQLVYACGQAGIFPVNDLAIWFALPNGIPTPATNLAGAATGQTVNLTWTDPTQDTNGNPVTIDSIQVFEGLPGQQVQIGHVAPGVQAFSVTNNADGMHSFWVRAKHGTWLSQFASVSVIVGTPSYFNNFDTNNGGWVADGVWEWGAPTNPDAPAPNSGANVWGTGLSANYANDQCGHLDLDPNMIVANANATLEFYAWWSMYPFSPYDGCNIKISIDGGDNWEALYPSTSYGSFLYDFTTCTPSDSAWSMDASSWRYVIVPLGQYVNQTPLFRFSFGSYSVSGGQYPGFFMDDMTMWGMGPRPNGIPLPVTNLTGTSGGTTTVTLNWTDPNHDTNGNPFTPDSILIFRGAAVPDSQIGHVTHGVQTIVIPNQVVGLRQYFVRSKASVFISPAVDVTVTVGSPSYSNSFETNNGDWVADGVWAWGEVTNTQGPEPHSGTNCWAIGLDANYNNSQCGHLDLNPGLSVASATATLEFWYWYQLEQGWDGVNVKVSTDDGATWEIVTPQDSYPGTTNGSWACQGQETAWTGSTSPQWRYAIIPIGQYVGQTLRYRFQFGSDGSVTYAGYFFDDMTIWGLQPPSDGIPRPVTNLAGNAGGTTTVTLTWTDPNQDTNGNPLTPDSILFYRDNAQPGSQIGHVAGGVQTVALLSQPVGQSTYIVRAKHGTFLSQTAMVNVLVGSPSYASNFDTDNGGWTADGAWEWGAPTNASGPQPHSGTNVWAVGLTGTYANSICGHMDLNLGLRVASPSATIEFWYWYQTESGFDGVNVQASVDNGATWTTLPAGYSGMTNGAWACTGQDSAWLGTQGNSWHYAIAHLGDLMGQTPLLRLTFGSDGSVTYAGFFLDDMIIWGMSPRQAVVGTVRHNGGSNPVLPGAWVRAGNDSVQTNAQGQYTLSVEPGTYTVRFRHDTHCDSTRAGIVVSEGQNTTLNVNLLSPTAALSASSLTFVVNRNGTASQPLVIRNAGACPLHYSIGDSATWLTYAPITGDVQPGDSTTVTVTVTPGIMQPDDYAANLRVSANAPGSPFVVHVDMSVLGVTLLRGDVPTEFALHQNYPNPFNPMTMLPFDVPRQSHVDLVVFNVMGQEVARLVSGNFAAGRYQATFDATDLPSGLYMVRMTAGGFTSLNKMMLLK